MAKTERNGRLVWRKQNALKVTSALLPQGIQPFLGVEGVFILERQIPAPSFLKNSHSAPRRYSFAYAFKDHR
ncbi:MAG: hypothetical protein ACJ8MO_31335 [Bacillus sp. (in: firmicutes)]